jgi:DNA-binding PadR family transcriptional regulator
MSASERKQIANKLTKDMLDPIVLGMALNEEKIHGYGIISKIRKEYNVYFGSSTIYPLLERLKEEGCLESNWEMKGERPRKVYTATPKAEIVYKAWIDQLRTMPMMNRTENTEFMVDARDEIPNRQNLRKSAR